MKNTENQFKDGDCFNFNFQDKKILIVSGLQREILPINIQAYRGKFKSKFGEFFGNIFIIYNASGVV